MARLRAVGTCPPNGRGGHLQVQSDEKTAWVVHARLGPLLDGESGEYLQAFAKLRLVEFGRGGRTEGRIRTTYDSRHTRIAPSIERAAQAAAGKRL